MWVLSIGVNLPSPGVKPVMLSVDSLTPNSQTLPFDIEQGPSAGSIHIWYLSADPCSVHLNVREECSTVMLTTTGDEGVRDSFNVRGNWTSKSSLKINLKDCGWGIYPWLTSLIYPVILEFLSCKIWEDADQKSLSCMILSGLIR